MTDVTIWQVFYYTVLLIVLYAWLRRSRRRKAAKKKINDSGWDMFCDEHFIEALDHIIDRFPEHSVGFCKARRDDEFDDDESMRCGYPECDKESTHEIHWIKFEEEKKK